ncbi:MAG: hypothetical protein KJ734_14035, partial [Chloroflexi bacterium]|nr:hypothetical protein [Chloroflexota bacterium]
MAFDGPGNKVVGATDYEWCYSQYTTRINNELAEGSELALVAYRYLVTGKSGTANTMHFSATITNNGLTALTNADLYFVVYEDLGAEKRYLVRDVLPPQYIASLAPGASVTFEGDSAVLPGVNLNNAGGVAFVQSRQVSPQDREVLQAAMAEEKSVLLVTPPSLLFVMHPNDPVTSTKTLQINQGGSIGFTWTADKDVAWLTVDPAAGSPPSTVSVRADRSGLTAGQWDTGHVTITASGDTVGSPHVVDVSLHTLDPGPPGQVDASADQDILGVNGVSTCTVQALVTDSAGIDVLNGTEVSFQTDLGTVNPSTATTVDGMAQTTLVSAATAGLGTVVVQAGTVSNTVGVRFVGPAHDIAVNPDVQTLRANGASSTRVSVQVTDQAGWPVFDGTVVTFTTDLGTVSPSSSPTMAGAASTVIRSSATPGWAHVTAWADAASGTVTMRFGGPPAGVSVTANPGLLPADGASTAVVMTTVSDQWGDPIIDGTPVTFTTDLGAVSPLSAATVGGVATTVLTADTILGPATVMALAETVSGTTVARFVGPPVTVSVAARPETLIADGVAMAVVTATVTDETGYPVLDG